MTFTGTVADWLQNGPALVSQGVDRVVLTDRHPYSQGGTSCWAAGWNGGWCVLPIELFRGLSDSLSLHRDGLLTHFESEEAALDALSAACIAWARAVNENATQGGEAPTP